jgi:hypothetical protein
VSKASQSWCWKEWRGGSSKWEVYSMGNFALLYSLHPEFLNHIFWDERVLLKKTKLNKMTELFQLPYFSDGKTKPQKKSDCPESHKSLGSGPKLQLPPLTASSLFSDWAMCAPEHVLSLGDLT